MKTNKLIDMNAELNTEKKEGFYSILASVAKNDFVPYEDNEDFYDSLGKSLYAITANSSMSHKKTMCCLVLEGDLKDVDKSDSKVYMKKGEEDEPSYVWRTVPWLKDEETGEPSAYVTLSVISEHDKDWIHNIDIKDFNQTMVMYVQLISLLLYPKYEGDVSIRIDAGIPEEVNEEIFIADA